MGLCASAADVELDDLPASSMAQSLFANTSDAATSDDLSSSTNGMSEMFKSAYQNDADLSSSMFLSASGQRPFNSSLISVVPAGAQ